MGVLRRGYNQNLNGLNPLGYVGVNSQNPPNIIIRSIAPTVNDSKNFYIGDLWIVTSNPSGSEQAWILVDLIGNEATWLQISGGGGGGTVQSLTGNTGGAVLPTAGNIDTLGGELINTVGNPGTSTVTINLNRGSNGQIPIASGSGPTLYENLTAGTGIAIVNAANSIIISATGSGGNAVAFLAKLETPIPSATGDGTVVELGAVSVPLTTIVNAGSAFTPGDGAGTPATFTAPVEGTYLFEVSADLATFSGSSDGNHTKFQIITTSRTYTTDINGDGVSGEDTFSLYFTCIANMESGDTAIFALSSGVGGDKDIQIGDTDTYVAGALLAASASTPTTYTTDSGNAVPSGGVLKILGQPQAGATVKFSGSGNTVDLNFTDGSSNTIIGLVAGNAGSLTGTANTGLGNAVLRFITSGVGNTCVGNAAGTALTSATGLTALGASAGASVTTGIDNVCIGSGSLASATTGSANAGANTALGTASLNLLTTGIQNTALGDSAGAALLTGNFNILIGGSGTGAGINFTGAESSNIIIGSSGTTGDNNTIRVGIAGSGTSQVNKCFIAGIRGITTTNANAIAVLVDSAGQLGTVSSSRRVKENIEDMSDESSDILNLRPVIFNYKSDPFGNKHYGLIAEEVQDILPRLVVHNQDGEVESVKYHELPAMLLNEIIKLNKRIEALEANQK